MTGMLWLAGAIGLVIGVIVRMLPRNPSAVVAGIVGVLVLGGGIVLAGAAESGTLYGSYALSVLCGLIGAVLGMAIPTVLSKIRPTEPASDEEDPLGLPATRRHSSRTRRRSSRGAHRHESSVH